MFDSNAFFKRRFSEHMKEMARYLRYIFNGHIAIAMLFLISALAYYYQQWLASLPENFPTAWVIGIVFGILATHSPVRTLLKEPDLVFIIAAEHRMGAYFRNSLIYSFVIQLYLILLAGAALSPLYFQTYPNRSGKFYLTTLLVLLIFKGGNLIANWWMGKVRDVNRRHIDQFVRLLLNIAIFFFLVNGDMLLAGIVTILFGIVFLFDYYVSEKQAGLAWDVLVEKDYSRMQTFYRIANMFTDVPHLKNKVKRRQWLVSLIDKLPFKNELTYDYLYRITFIRSGDYLGMYLRLIVIGGLLIYVVPNPWMKILFAILFLYMSSFQMMTLYQHHRTVMWLDIYPVNSINRQHALLKWMHLLTFTQTVLFVLVFLLKSLYIEGLSVLVGGIVFNYLFINGYVKNKLV